MILDKSFSLTCVCLQISPVNEELMRLLGGLACIAVDHDIDVPIPKHLVGLKAGWGEVGV